MPRTNTAELILGANSQRLRQGLSAGSRDIQNFSTRTKTMLAGLGTSLKRNLFSIPGQLGLIGGTAGLFMLGRNIVKFDEQLNRLGIAGNMTRKQIFGLREEMFRTGLEVGKSRSDIAEGVATVLEKTGNIKFALATYKDLAKASQATGASMGEFGAMAAQLDEKFKIEPTGLMEALDVLAGQGKSGAFTLEHLATQGERMLAAAQRLGMVGIEDLTRLGAYSQIAMSATGEAAMAATVVERTISEIIEKQAKLKKDYNIDIMDKGGKYRKFDELLKEIITKTKGSELKLGEIFSERAIRGVSLIASAFRETGRFGRFDEFLQGEYSGTIEEDVKVRLESLSVQFARMLVLFDKLGESSMLPSMGKINKALQDLLDNPDKLVELDNRFKSIGLTVSRLAEAVMFLTKHWKILLGGFALLKGFNFARSIGLFRGKGGTGALGGVLGAGGAGIPVSVTNWPLGFGAGKLGSGLVDQFGRPLTSAGAAAAGPSALAMGVSALALQVGLVGAAGYAIALAIKKQYDLEKQLQEDVDFYDKTGIKRVLNTAGSEQSAAPAVSLRNEIRLDVHVDKEGKLIGAAVLDSPAPGVSTQTFLESVFAGGDR